MHAFIPCSTESMNPYRAVDSSIGFVNSRGEPTAALHHLGAASGGLDSLRPTATGSAYHALAELTSQQLVAKVTRAALRAAEPMV